MKDVWKKYEKWAGRKQILNNAARLLQLQVKTGVGWNPNAIFSEGPEDQPEEEEK